MIISIRDNNSDRFFEIKLLQGYTVPYELLCEADSVAVRFMDDYGYYITWRPKGDVIHTVYFPISGVQWFHVDGQRPFYANMTGDITIEITSEGGYGYAIDGYFMYLYIRGDYEE